MVSKRLLPISTSKIVDIIVNRLDAKFSLLLNFSDSLGGEA